ncbi:uncharacterized protein YALI1_E01877g [Yarrowia lipolytica]|uniref:Uncharacterized protein n=1 Tax=Yarrowia lipolytica TaxID=4952 RepID=A0A1D8NGN6_YARLL|nr:hypothetical protein YALI1_E01877g [Yarrowia lipolytica]
MKSLVLLKPIVRLNSRYQHHRITSTCTVLNWSLWPCWLIFALYCCLRTSTLYRTTYPVSYYVPCIVLRTLYRTTYPVSYYVLVLVLVYVRTVPNFSILVHLDMPFREATRSRTAATCATVLNNTNSSCSTYNIAAVRYYPFSASPVFILM